MIMLVKKFIHSLWLPSFSPERASLRILSIRIIGLVLTSLAIVGSGCGSTNLLQSYSKQDGDEALIEDAKKLIDKGDYTGALVKLNSMSANYPASGSEQKTNFYQTRAAAYAGNCGLIFTTFTSNFSGSGNFITKARNAFLGIDVDSASCALAQADIEALGTNATRTANQNFFLAILGLAKLGTVLRESSDADDDGVVDVTWTGCKEDAIITDAQVNLAFTGLGLLIDNLAAIGGSVSGLNTTDITTFNTTCAAALGVASCSLTNTNDVTAAMTFGFRKFIDSTTDGIGVCSHQVGGVCCSNDTP